MENDVRADLRQFRRFYPGGCQHARKVLLTDPLLRVLEEIENCRPVVAKSRMKRLVDVGYSISESAAVEKY